jgi:hypothetical protein
MEVESLVPNASLKTWLPRSYQICGFAGCKYIRISRLERTLPPRFFAAVRNATAMVGRASEPVPQQTSAHQIACHLPRMKPNR